MTGEAPLASRDAKNEAYRLSVTLTIVREPSAPLNGAAGFPRIAMDTLAGLKSIARDRIDLRTHPPESP